jgi:hypothetical protein
MCLARFKKTWTLTIAGRVVAAGSFFDVAQAARVFREQP